MSIGKGADYKYKKALFQFCAEELCGRILAIIYSYKKNKLLLLCPEFCRLRPFVLISKEWKLGNMAYKS